LTGTLYINKTFL